jgi:LGFP repeat
MRESVQWMVLLVVVSLLLYLPACNNCGNVVLTNVVTQHNNNNRTGAFLLESKLTPASVASGFGLLYSRNVNGAIYAQPLYIHGVQSSVGTKNLFFIATETNWVYAFDADDMSASASPIFSRQLQPPGAADHNAVCGETPSGIIGITGTPVIDPDANVMYVVAHNGNSQTHYLHKLDITNNFNDLATPVAMGGTDPLSGVSFTAGCERNRAGLLLNNGIVYAGFGGYSCDHCTDPNNHGYHGWVLGYKANDLSPAAIYCTSCSGGNIEVGIWQTGGGLASDGANIYVETGNPVPGGPSPPGDSFLQLQITNSWPGLSLAGHYTPANAATLANGDTDLGSGGPVVLSNKGLLVGGGKQGRFYVINTSSMSLAQDPAGPPYGFDGFQAFTNTYHNDPSQGICTPAGGATGCNAQPGTTCYVDPSQYGNGEICGPNIHGTPVYWEFADSNFGYIYHMSEKDYLKAFKFDNATAHLNETPSATSTDKPPDGMPGGFSSLSASFGTNGIVWTSFPLGDSQWNLVPGRLAAFDALTLNEIWHDDGGYIFAKSVPPTISEGKVYRATGSGFVLVYGMLGTMGMHRQSPKGLEGAEAGQKLDEIYRRTGAENGLLGTPQGEVRKLEDGGWVRDFKSKRPIHGYTTASVRPSMKAMNVSCSKPLPPEAYTEVESSIYWGPRTGAYIVMGELRQFWLKQGGPNSKLGYPTSDEGPAPDGLGRMSSFEHGDVIWHYNKGAVMSLKP